MVDVSVPPPSQKVTSVPSAFTIQIKFLETLLDQGVLLYFINILYPLTLSYTAAMMEDLILMPIRNTR